MPGKYADQIEWTKELIPSNNNQTVQVIREQNMYAALQKADTEIEALEQQLFAKRGEAALAVAMFNNRIAGVFSEAEIDEALLKWAKKIAKSEV